MSQVCWGAMGAGLPGATGENSAAGGDVAAGEGAAVPSADGVAGNTAARSVAVRSRSVWAEARGAV